MPGSFHGMINGISKATGFVEAVSAGIRAAGDNCSRNTFIGACVAAKYVMTSYVGVVKYQATPLVLHQL